MIDKTILKVTDLNFAYEQQSVLNKVSLTVYDRDYIGIIGPNGGGKTTLIKLILGLLKPQHGTINYGIEKSDIGYLPQGNPVDESFPITVKEVVASGLKHGLVLGKAMRKNDRTKVSKMLDRVGLNSLAQRSIGELSGGEFQRTLLARAIISNPRLLVLDEPDTHVDNKFELELYTLLKDLNENMAILLVLMTLALYRPI